ncbi:hypothetical protein EV421DRAFT_2019499 [Armillaria borealis]|uniref:Uncharacterized protein n=1 Tax=Armillaria borealis TaxID=47425 RepID=A0AA39JJA9_9AGAR|nr:hypothetical protein EV421DRAFT_2019499 [Armillaria borealis]
MYVKRGWKGRPSPHPAPASIQGQISPKTVFSRGPWDELDSLATIRGATLHFPPLIPSSDPTHDFLSDVLIAASSSHVFNSSTLGGECTARQANKTRTLNLVFFPMFGNRPGSTNLYSKLPPGNLLESRDEYRVQSTFHHSKLAFEWELFFAPQPSSKVILSTKLVEYRSVRENNRKTHTFKIQRVKASDCDMVVTPSAKFNQICRQYANKNSSLPKVLDVILAAASGPRIQIFELHVLPVTYSGLPCCIANLLGGSCCLPSSKSGPGFSIRTNKLEAYLKFGFKYNTRQYTW